MSHNAIGCGRRPSHDLHLRACVRACVRARARKTSQECAAVACSPCRRRLCDAHCALRLVGALRCVVCCTRRRCASLWTAPPADAIAAHDEVLGTHRERRAAHGYAAPSYVHRVRARDRRHPHEAHAACSGRVSLRCVRAGPHRRVQGAERAAGRCRSSRSNRSEVRRGAAEAHSVWSRRPEQLRHSARAC